MSYNIFEHFACSAIIDIDGILQYLQCLLYFYQNHKNTYRLLFELSSHFTINVLV